ncbi:unnamed protein product [Knipowitschia caucasica]|uniref:Paired domain-containing protein n=2 Tax=Knipowitschia caucasica TaxID=637954 RepID=A0AAV2KSZ1_KNICA
MAQDKIKDGTSQACNENKESPVNDTASPLDRKRSDGTSDTSAHGEQDTVASSPKMEDLVKMSANYAMIGNKLAGAGDFKMAAQYFTEAIKYNPTEFKLFGNRAFCFEKMQEFEKSLSDAELSLSMSPGWVKGHFRKGRALAGLKRYKEAAAAFKDILELDSSSKEAAQEMMRVQTLQLMECGSEDKAQKALLTSKKEDNPAGIWTSPDLGKANAVQSVHFPPSITATAPLTVPQQSPAKVSNRQLPESLKLKMIDAHKAGEGYKKIAKRLQVPIPSVRNVIKKWQLTGTVEVKERSGRPRKITDIMVHNIVTKASQNPYLTVKAMQEELAQTGVVVHCSTIKRYLYKHGVHGKSLQKKSTSVSSAQTLPS